MGRLDDRIGELEAASRGRGEKLREELRGERDQRNRADQELRSLVQQLAIGGLQLEFVGLCWLILGVVMATWNESLPALSF